MSTTREYTLPTEDAAAVWASAEAAGRGPGLPVAELAGLGLLVGPAVRAAIGRERENVTPIRPARRAVTPARAGPIGA